MKFDRNKAFPYPVLWLHSDDYTDVEFQATVDFSVGKVMIGATIGYALSSDEILKVISNKRAEYISCSFL